MTTRDRLFLVTLWLSVIGLAIWLGGTVYQMLVIVPLWSENPPASVHAFFEGTRYNQTIWNFFGPPFMAARLLPLFAALFLSWHLPLHRKWLLVGSAGMVFGVVFTLLYVYPMNEILFTNAGRTVSGDEVQGLVNSWIFADRLRFVIGAISFLAVLRALTIPVPANSSRSLPADG